MCWIKLCIRLARLRPAVVACCALWLLVQDPQVAGAKPAATKAPVDMAARAEGLHAKHKFFDAAQLWLQAWEADKTGTHWLYNAARSYEEADMLDEAAKYYDIFLAAPGDRADIIEKAKGHTAEIKRQRQNGGIPVILGGAEAATTFAQQLGMGSVVGMLSQSKSRFSSAIKRKKEQSDVRPRLDSFTGHVASGGRNMTLELDFSGGKLYRIGRSWLCSPTDVVTQAAVAPFGFTETLPGGNRLIQVRAGHLIERVILPVGQKPLCEWWLYDTAMDKKLGAHEHDIFVAFGWNDAGVAALEPPINRDQANIAFRNALKVIPGYAPAAGRFCEMLVDSGNYDHKLAKAICKKAAHSKHKMWQKKAKANLKKIPK